MPKPVKKPARKRSTKPPARPSGDPNRRAHQVLANHLDKLAEGKWADQLDVTPPHGDTFREQLSLHMAKLGAKGGKIGGKRRLETMTAKRRKEVAAKAAAARWGNRDK